MNTQWRVSALAGALGILLLSGCTAPPTIARSVAPSGEQTEEASTPTPSELPAADIPFEPAPDLGQGDIAWDDQFVVDDRFSVLSADDGNGSWSYIDNANECHISFYQGTISDLDPAADDRTSTDGFLVDVLSPSIDGLTLEDMSSYAYDDEISATDGRTVALRSIGGSADEGATWVDSARMFGSFGGGVFVSVACPSAQDAYDERQQLTDAGLLSVILSPGAGG